MRDLREIIMNEDWAEKELSGKKKQQYNIALKLSTFDIEKLLLVEELLEDLYYQYPEIAEIEAIYMIIEDINKKLTQQI